ncbi:hypothetical protein [Paracidobacterium acidisoli]|uniref:hypothetical protein n=1 Tax=Paracidobacterium acidisoli TaxID=2303751 RepID=UPI000E3B8E31|nr:hypothetical protein [Paracidobacterium acidisoli]MBT9330792.1 hypothetical protein [Paracidobacterium acidisoli]
MPTTARIGCSVLLLAACFTAVSAQALSPEYTASSPATDSQPVSLPDSPGALLQQQQTTPPASSSSSSAQTQTQTQTQPQNQKSGTPADTKQQQRDQAQQQLKQQEQQRVMGVMATFNTTTNRDALPLTPGQKFQLFFKSATDPWPFVLTGFSAGIDQAQGAFPEYGGGIGGFAKRYGADYATYFAGNFFGNAVLPSLWHEDPRYFQKGTGSYTGRALWAAASTVWCRRDNGTWGPNYANVIGNLMGAAFSNLYFPDSDRTVGDTLERGVTVSAEGIVGAEVIEFWPDIARRYKRKHAEKLARQAAQKDAQSSGVPAPPPAPQP